VARWLIRKDLFGDCVSDPLRVEDSDPIARIPGVLSLEEYAAQQLAAGERLLPEEGRFWIDARGQRVGYFDVVDHPPPSM
jgi:hypothetical protein